MSPELRNIGVQKQSTHSDEAYGQEVHVQEVDDKGSPLRFEQTEESLLDNHTFATPLNDANQLNL